MTGYPTLLSLTLASQQKQKATSRAITERNIILVTLFDGYGLICDRMRMLRSYEPNRNIELWYYTSIRLTSLVNQHPNFHFFLECWNVPLNTEYVPLAAEKDGHF